MGTAATGSITGTNLKLDVVPLDRSHYERRDAMAFEMAARGDPEARDAILRIIQRDQSEVKRARAADLLKRLDAA